MKLLNGIRHFTSFLKLRHAIAVCMLLLWAGNSLASVDTLSELVVRSKKALASQKVDLLSLKNWNITITYPDNSVKKLIGEHDTVDYGQPAKVSLTNSIYILPALRNSAAVLSYDYSGSAKVKVNGNIILATGIYDTTGKEELKYFKKNGLIHLVLNDTLLVFEIEYTPHPSQKICSFSGLSLMTPQRAEKKQEEHYQDINSSYALGFYYLAFGIVFIILFLFFREKTEHLFFSLFCISASLSWLLNTSENEHIDQFSVVAFVYALEFLSLFLAKVLANKNKSLLHLVVITVLSAISMLPVVRYNYVHFFGQPVPLYKGISIVCLICYSGFSSIYFLFQGFGQKRWEAKTILFICLSAVFIGMVLPAIISTLLVNSHKFEELSYAGYLVDLGLCMYPLSAAIVLGRRNGLNQKQLIKQVASIETLSRENLEKEQEKKQILEAQNAELEHKVEERTQEVIKQKEIIEIKNKSITDNLIYAQRIQSAILPDVKLISKSFEQSFIIYMPKDIVSGDFYSFAEKDGQHIIVAGDCTGHGVSGAFMSMIGSSLLNQIIAEKNVTGPAQILTQLNTAVIDTLKQGQNESNDGMDISICSFDKNSKKLHYAGANRPLWLIRNNELIIVRPDKFPIGGLQMARNREFHDTTLDLQTGDTVYLFTDGFADQFGGERGKKLMIGRFKEMLLSIQELDMKAQGSYLNASFKKWKGENEQVDDVLVIGIRM